MSEELRAAFLRGYDAYPYLEVHSVPCTHADRAWDAGDDLAAEDHDLAKREALTLYPDPPVDEWVVAWTALTREGGTHCNVFKDEWRARKKAGSLRHNYHVCRKSVRLAKVVHDD